MHEKNLSQLVEDLNVNIRNNPQGTDKLWPHRYIDGFYEKEFERRRKCRCRILEIGFRHGASLHLWANYFSDTEILGLDNGSDTGITEDNPVNRGWLSNKRIETRIGDAYSKEFSKLIDSKYDIILDDGPHTLSSQLKFLELYLDNLSSDGVAVIEDLQRYGGLILWPLIIKTPLKYHVEFYDFRKESNVYDDMLFVVRNLEKSSLKNRLGILLLALRYIITEPIEVIERMLKPKYYLIINNLTGNTN